MSKYSHMNTHHGQCGLRVVFAAMLVAESGNFKMEKWSQNTSGLSSGTHTSDHLKYHMLLSHIIRRGTFEMMGIHPFICQCVCESNWFLTIISARMHDIASILEL